MTGRSRIVSACAPRPCIRPVDGADPIYAFHEGGTGRYGRCESSRFGAVPSGPPLVCVRAERGIR
jgi:hypothetical protein